MPTKKPPVKSYDDLVVVEWCDACSSQGWSDTITPDDGIASCTSVGRIVHEDKTQIVLAATWSDKHHNQRMAIPVSWIRKRSRLPTRKAPSK